MIVLDVTIVNVALPSIKAKLDFSASTLASAAACGSEVAPVAWGDLVQPALPRIDERRRAG
jgi:hypothetical protein